MEFSISIRSMRRLGTMCAAAAAAVASLGIAAFLATTANAGTWEVTQTPTNSKSPDPASVGSSSTAFASSSITTLSANAAAWDTSSSTLTPEAQASYSGTWTFRWIPDNSSDWPSTYVITSTKIGSFSAAGKDGTGTARIRYTGGADIINFTLPTSATPSRSNPAPTITSTTPATGLAVTTIAFTRHNSFTMSGGWAESVVESTITKRTYSATYFTTNFSTPGDVMLTFTVDSKDITSSVSFSSSVSTGTMSANADQPPWVAPTDSLASTTPLLASALDFHQAAAKSRGVW